MLLNVTKFFEINVFLNYLLVDVVDGRIWILEAQKVSDPEHCKKEREIQKGEGEKLYMRNNFLIHDLNIFSYIRRTFPHS